jgi:TonB family protein
LIVLFSNPLENAQTELEKILPMWKVPFHSPIIMGFNYTTYVVDKMPRYKHGSERLLSYLCDTAASRVSEELKSSDGYIDVEYIIGSDSSLSEIKILKHSKIPAKYLHHGREMIEDMAGNWAPAEIGGETVNCVQRHRIYFTSGKNKSERGSYRVHKEKSFAMVENRAPYTNHNAMFRGSASDYEAVIRKHLLYPTESLKHCVSSDLTVRCTIELDGTLNAFYIAQKDSIGYGCEQQAIAALKHTNYRWTPAYTKNHFVRSEKTLSVSFSAGYQTPKDMISNKGEGKLYEVFEVSTAAKFKKGLDSFYTRFREEFKYPMLASSYNKGGRIMVSFVVERDGSISSIQVLKESERYYCFEEAVQEFIMTTDGEWDPAMLKHTAVRSKVVLPLMFQIN